MFWNRKKKEKANQPSEPIQELSRQQSTTSTEDTLSDCNDRIADYAVSMSTDGSGVNSQAFVDALSAHIGVARLRQLAFGRDVVIGDWNVIFSEGIIAFGGNRYPIQFIGSESEVNNTWMWAINNINHFPDAILVDVNRFYNSALMKEFDDLKEIKLDLNDLISGHNIASLVADTCEERACYYRCPYDGGAAYVLVKNIPASVFSPVPGMDIIRLINDLTSQLTLNHRLLAVSLLKANCSQVDEQGSVIIGKFDDGNILQVEFDSLDRIVSMKL